ncbi:helix-turn-helix domain-containing protein [Streptomyces sp. NPDC002018]|uniref:helix-turn-helix domain-containing protein n=1 Tax=Streptomyces sp. NPDC002018 TaxID=3364629 RepID=UPI00368FBF6A
MPTTEAEAFAGLLREVKDRSGRSYGVLAGKLHMSTSTLHRYCNGDAVPAEFASVERLARLCGATAEELVELHRRWILADEARRRARSAAPPAAAPPAAPPAAAPAASVPATPVSEPGPAPAPDPASAPASAVESAQSGPAMATSVPEVRTSRDAPRTPGGVRTGVSAGRLRLVLAAVAVVAVAVPAVVLGGRAALSSGDGSVAASAADTPGEGKGAGAGTPSSAPAEAKSPSVSPSDSRPADASPPASPGASRTPAADRASSGADTAPATGAVPVAVSVRPYAFEDPCSQHYLIDRPPAEVPPPPTEQDAAGWVNALGGVASDGQFIELTVQGTGAETVVLQALRVRVVKSGAPLAWTDYAMGVGCGGGVSTKSFDIDLDAARPGSVPKAGQRDFPYKVSESDPEVLYVSARASTREVSWYLELEWSSGERHGTLRVDDRGRPFRTSGASGRPRYDYPPGGTQWQPAATG